MFHSNWNPIFPTVQDNTTKNNVTCFRSIIWVNKNQKPGQVAIDHPDLTAVYAQVGKRDLFIASIYIPCSSNRPEADEKVLRSRLDLVKKPFMKEKETCLQLEVILAGDFNRWDTLWGGNPVASHLRQGEGSLIIDLMADLDLQLLLPQGTITYQGGRAQSSHSSTLDLIFTTEKLATGVLICQPHETQHRSDHKAIESKFSLMATAIQQSPRLLFKQAPWEKICNHISEGLDAGRLTAKLKSLEEFTKQLMSLMTEAMDKHAPIAKASQYAKRWWTEDLKEFTKQLMSLMTEAMDKHVPIAKASQYAKRWWTEDLTALRSEYTQQRNQASRARRHGFNTAHLEISARTAKRRYYTALRKQKKRHWKEFLDESANIWQASSYMTDQKSKALFSPIPVLQSSGGIQLQKDDEIAEVFLETFFPQLPPYVPPDTPSLERYNQLPMPELEEKKVEQAIFSASSLKAPGVDRIPALV